MRILVTMPDGRTKSKFFCEENKKILSDNFSDIVYNDLGRDYTPDELTKAINGFDIIVTGWGTPSFMTDNSLDKTDTVKMIAHTAGSTGDLLGKDVYDKGITVVSGNKMFAESVAEGTIAYMLSALRYIPEEVMQMRSGEMPWKNIPSAKETEGLFDKTVGIIGLGTISQYLMEMLKIFRCKIKIYSQFPMDTEYLKSVNAESVGLEEVFSTCPIVSLHSALNEKTINMIRKKHFDMMQDGAIFINTARGAIVNQKEMTEALANGRIRAFLDVYTAEPLPANDPLRAMQNVYLTPHRGGPTFDRWRYIGKGVLEDVVRFSRGEKLKYEITRELAARMTVNKTKLK